MMDTVPFAASLTPDGKYLSLRIPVAYLPATLLKQPGAMNVRILPEPGPAPVGAEEMEWVAPFRMELSAR